MRTLCIVGAFAVTLSGCSKQPSINSSSERIVALEKQVMALDARCVKLESNFVEVIAIVKMSTTSALAFNEQTVSAIEAHQENWAVLSNSIIRVLSELGTKPAAQAVPQRIRPQPQPTKNGVPQSVYDRISAQARVEWPDNYQLQLSFIERECSAWLKLNR